MKIPAILLASAGAMGLSISANATTIDFSGYSDYTPIGNTYSALGVTFSSNAYFLQCGGGCPAPTPNGFFAYASANSFTVDFATAQTSVTFQTVTNSSTLATAYTATNMAVASVGDNESGVVSNQVDVLSSSTPFTSIIFSYDGGINGPAVTNLTFNGAAAVPEPTTWALMLAGFGMIGYVMRKRLRSTVAYS